jgi:hypothetical protein
VSELASLLELMHTSARGWQTIQAAGSEWRHRDRLRQAVERSLPGDGSAVTLLTTHAADEPDPEPEEVREPWRLWLAPPDRVRAEFRVEEDMVTAVIVGDTWWSWSPLREVTTNQGDPHHSHGTGPGHALIDPAAILPAVELGVTDRGTFIGRTALTVVATPSPRDENDEESFDWRTAAHNLGDGADEYMLLVDAERGILLRSEARIEGSPFRIIEMESAAFDEDLGEDTFTPPPARDIEPAWSPRVVSLADLPDKVSFAVLVPEHPPFGPVDASIFPSRRRGIGDQVHISFGSMLDGEQDRQFWLFESAAPIPTREGVEWQDSGDIRFGEDRRVHPPLRIVRLERMSTHVEVNSYYLGLEELLDLARSLVPLPATPPRLRAARE